MRFSTICGSSSLLDNRRFLWTAAIAFAVAAILFPLVLLAAFGHFSSTAPGAAQPYIGGGDSSTGAAGHEAVPTSMDFPSMAPGTNTPTEPLSPTTHGPGVVLDHAELPPTGRPSSVPSAIPSDMPSLLPSDEPSVLPSLYPSAVPTKLPTPAPTNRPTPAPTRKPTPDPTKRPTSTPTKRPTSPPTSEQLITYRPGQLTVNQNGLLLSTGLSARIIARTGRFVPYHNGKQSSVRFHTRPDYGATFVDPSNPDGWIYVSNSEARENGQGGVGAIYFDGNGNVIKYEKLLKGTTLNCGGGRTPWNTFISCEEWGNRGQVYQVDPSGKRTAQKTVLGAQGGRFESFSYDVRNRNKPRFFVTEDAARGALRRFTPSQANWNDPWTMLHGDGTLEYLVLEPTGNGRGNYKWVSNIGTGRANAQKYYPDSEGIDVYGSQLFFVCKKIKQLFTLDLDKGTYTNRTTRSGLFDGAPDQMKRILAGGQDILYFTEEGGRDAGIHGRNQQGNFFTILESPEYIDETTGLAWDPSGRHLYVAYQENGLLFDVTRNDGLPFFGTSLNVKYHAQGQG